MGEGLLQIEEHQTCCSITTHLPTGWNSLTPSELRVAELVSHGHTYRDIAGRLYVSRRTVETHVAHAFTKLGLRSKAALASAYVARFGLPF